MREINITYPKHYREMKIGDIKKECMQIFSQKLSGKSVINKETGAKIILSKSGAKHALFARTGGFEKIIALTKIDEIIKNASLLKADKSNKSGDLLMMKFSAKIKIDTNNFVVDVFVRVTKEGKFYYDHVLLT